MRFGLSPQGRRWRPVFVGIALLPGLACYEPHAFASAAPSAQATGDISGRVLDTTGAAIPYASVSITGATGVSRQTVSDATGMYTFLGLPAGQYTISVAKPGFASLQQAGIALAAGQSETLSETLKPPSNTETVTVHSSELNGATPTPTQGQVFHSDQSIRVLDRKQMDVAGPVAGAAQIISLTPGANVTGYGNTGATKYTITLNGINQGWGGYGGFTGGGSLGVTFDGVPIVDPVTGLWQSPTIPQTDMIQSTAVTYGPGNPANRWYTNIGGSVEFTPVQPTAAPHADATVTYGSYHQKNLEFNLSSGLHDGWATELSFGGGTGDDFRRSPDGFQNPSKDFAVLSKTIKTAGSSSFELGGYYAHAGGYRSQVIPVVGNPGITVSGQPGGAEYSQQTSGFYSTLPYASYNKYDTNDMTLIYGRETLRLDPTTQLQNLAWFMRIDRTHYRTNDIFDEGPQLREWNNPHTNTVGDRIQLSKRIPHNNFTVDGYYIHGLYNTRNNFFNPADGGSKTLVNIGGQIRSSYFSQDDFAVSAQDRIRLFNNKVELTPGLRFAGFTTQYSSDVPEDFSFAPGVVLNTTCRYTTAAAGTVAGNTTNQGSCPSARENRTGLEPSGSATIAALPWLQLYGGYLEALKAPQVGGGGGLFQSVDPSSYHLARQRYYQAGFKTINEGRGMLNSFILGAAFFHQNYANQEIDVGLASGDTISSDGTSSYHGVNAFADDDPIENLHLFVNASLERAVYTYYVVAVNPDGSAGQSYNGSSVPYVPSSTVNLGGYYKVALPHDISFEPNASFEAIGIQHLFDNSIGAPSTQTMPSYQTLNLGFSVPFRHVIAHLSALNVLDKSYNEYEYISSGSYFGTSGNATDSNGYTLAYPAAPFTLYGGISASF